MAEVAWAVGKVCGFQCVCVRERETYTQWRGNVGLLKGFRSEKPFHSAVMCQFDLSWGQCGLVLQLTRRERAVSRVVRRRQWYIQRDMQLPASRRRPHQHLHPRSPSWGGGANSQTITAGSPVWLHWESHNLNFHAYPQSCQRCWSKRPGGPCEHILLMLAQSHSSSEWSDPCSLS